MALRSRYPGNTNQLVVKLSTYAEALAHTGGVVPEFVNPKYQDASKETFKAPTRLECMMQDYPKLLLPTANVGFTTFDDFFYSPVKNNTADAASKVAAGQSGACAATGEADLYAFGARLLGLTGRRVSSSGDSAPTGVPSAPAEAASVAEPCTVSISEPRRFLGIPVSLGPAIVLSPSFATTTTEAADKIIGGSISATSTLIVEGNGVTLENLRLNGALIVRVVPGATVRIKNLTVENRGWEFVRLEEEEDEVSEDIAIRGYRLVKHEERVLNFTEPGHYEVSE